MNDDSKNKVCFDCAGIPVIRRIIANLRLGGVKQFVLVVGHKAESVKETLSGENSLIYAYQKEQRGTGDAARCGLEALQKSGFSGNVIITMGDKIVAPEVIHQLAARLSQMKSKNLRAIWCVQSVANNPGGGRIILHNQTPCGVVEWADIAYQSLAALPQSQWEAKLSSFHLNEKKKSKVISRALVTPPTGNVTLNNNLFSAKELQSASYANGGLYGFELSAILEALHHCTSDNAQGEIYLTDTLEFFARNRQADLMEIPTAQSMLTFSTKADLQKMSWHFLRTAEEYLTAFQTGKWDEKLLSIYGKEQLSSQRERYLTLIQEFIRLHGNQKIIVTRAPGRLNLMGRHIDHRGGDSNVMTIDRDILLSVAPRKDNMVQITNLDSHYPPASFSIQEELAPGENINDWLDFLALPQVRQKLEATRGHWSNYVKAAILRFQRAMDFPLCGMTLVASGNIPCGAGLSSSSALVVATAEAVVHLNCLNLTQKQFIDLCGEGEWFVGSRGGAGDHAAMKCGRHGFIVQLGFLPFQIKGISPFPEEMVMIVANSGDQAKKSEGSRDLFNERIACYEIALHLLQQRHPLQSWHQFRDISASLIHSQIYELLKELPLKTTRQELLHLLPQQSQELERLFETHKDPGFYDLRGITLYGLSECARASQFSRLLARGKYQEIGRWMKISHDGDRLQPAQFTDETLDEFRQQNIPLTEISGWYGCSTKRIDELCDLLNRQPGVQGSSIVGAGLGGSVIALVKKEAAVQAIKTINCGFYDAHGLPHAAEIYRPGAGSMVF